MTGYFRRRAWSYEIIISANGEDGTRELAREFALNDPAVRVIGEPARCGKDRGIRDAVAIAPRRIVGFADADNKVPIDEVGRLEPWLERAMR